MSVPEVPLALRLFEVGLLPERHRERFVRVVVEYAIEGIDGYIFESKKLRKMLSRREKKDLFNRARTELIPNLADARDNWQDNHPGDEDPESYMQPFIEFLSALGKTFGRDAGSKETIRQEQRRVREWIDNWYWDMRGQQDDSGYEDPEYGEMRRSQQAADDATRRSIFDDIDL